MPIINSTTATRSEIDEGSKKFFLKFLADALRQEINGQTPVIKSKAKPIGTFTWLKKGGPIVIFTPLTASDITGNMVPQKTEKAAPTRMRLLNRKVLSRERRESSWFSLFKDGRR